MPYPIFVEKRLAGKAGKYPPFFFFFFGLIWLRKVYKSKHSSLIYAAASKDVNKCMHQIHEN